MSDVQPGQPFDLAPLDEPGDAELISAVRGGDLDAYGMLFARHVDSARRLARQLVSAGDVDDLVSDAFAKVLAVLQRGGGPDLAFRAYLLTSLRRLHVDKLRAGARVTTTGDMAAYDPGVPFEDTAVSGFDNAAAAKAFASLPERWQQVLWHTEVEGQKPAEIAPLLGISANSVSALAYRAREGLRQAFISMHAQDAATDVCANTRANFGAYLRGGSSRRDGAKVEEHLESCPECSAIYLELAEVNNDLGAVLAPLLLGGAGAGYLAAAHVGAAAAAKGGFLLLLDRTKDWVLHNPVGRATAGATGVAVAAAVVAAAALGHGSPAPQASAPAPSAPAVSGPATPAAPGTPGAPAQSGAQQPSSPPAQTPPLSVPVAPVPSLPSSTPVTAAPHAPVTAPPHPPVAVPPTPPATPSAPEAAPTIQTPLAPVTATTADTPVTIDLTRGAVDPNGDPITIRSADVARPSHGTVVINRTPARPLTGRTLADFVTSRTSVPAANTTVTYTPDPGWRGTDTISYVLTDGHGGTVDGTVQVRTPNAVPVATDDSAQATVGWLSQTPITINVLGNDTDANADALAITAVTQPENGSVEIVGDAIRYTPPAGLGDTTDTFGYTVSDGHGGTADATVTVTLGALPDRAPTAQSFSRSTEYGTPVTVDLASYSSDPDGDALEYAVSAPGSDVALDAAGNATYRPEPGFSGVYSFDYTVSDGRGGTDSATVTITVGPPPNHAPTADSFDTTVAYGGSTSIDLAAHASDPDGDKLSYARGDEPAHGSVTIAADGKAIYHAASDYSGPDSFSYTVTDSSGAVASGTVSITVQQVASDVELTSSPVGVSGYEHVYLSASGIPNGHSATLHVHISGITGWHPNGTHELGSHVTGADCTLASALSGDLICAVDGDGELLHFDFDFTDPWSVDASLTPDDFTDSTPGDTGFHRDSADGRGLGQ